MKLKYLGTCAAEGFPGMFCSCETCEKARRLGGRNIRTRSQALVDGELLIDFPADTYLHILNYGLDLRKIKACIELLIKSIFYSNWLKIQLRNQFKRL